jgi:hypothetical protein
MGGPLDWFKKIYESEKKKFNRSLNRIKKEGIIQASIGGVSDGAEMMLRDAGLGNAADAVDEYTNYEIEKFNEGCEKLSKKGIIQGSLGMVSDGVEDTFRAFGLDMYADAVDEYTNYEIEKFNDEVDELSKKGVVSYAKGVGEDVIQKFDIIGGNSQNSQAAQNGEKGGIKILSDVAQELGLQKGGEPQLTGQYAVANAKLNVGLATRAKESKDPIVEEKQVRTSSVNSTSYKTPELDR